MRIGVPREVKDGEYRVALTPLGVKSLSNVVVEAGAGKGAGFSDGDYLKTGVQVHAGKVTHAHLARDTGRAYTAP